MPTIQSLSENIKADKVKIILVNTAESEDVVFEFLSLIAPDLDSLLDQDGLVTERWQPRGLPATFFISPKGRLRYLALGGRDWNSSLYLNFINSLVALKE
jgi:hypothetical protein